MKITVTTTDQQTFTGADAQDIVSQMRDAQWNAPDKKRDYMQQTAERVEQMTGERPRTDATGFLTDLAKAGLITVSATPGDVATLETWLTGEA